MPTMRFQLRPEPFVYILSLIATVTKEPDMLQTDAFCHFASIQCSSKLQLLLTLCSESCWGSYSAASPDLLDDFKRVASGVEGKGQGGRGREAGRTGKEKGC